MRIIEVSVKNLFGTFDHVVPLKTKDRITIIHGPNGFGKTIMLRMIYALFTRRYHSLLNVPFDEFLVRFDDGNNLLLRKSTKSEHDDTQHHESTIDFELTTNGNKLSSFVYKPRKVSDLNFPLELIEHEIPELERSAADAWLYPLTREVLSLDEVLTRFQDRLPMSRKAIKEPKDSEWLQQLIGRLQVYFVEAQRLISFSPRRRREYEGRIPTVLVVAAYSEELAAAMQNKLKEYGELSQSLDRSFPTRLLRSGGLSQLTNEEIQKNLAGLEQKRLRLTTAGLLDRAEEIDVGRLPMIDETNRNVLSVYVDDVGKKLAVFDELTNRVDTLLHIINNRFLYKQMSISKKDGFLFKTAAGDLLSPAVLSSGEQQEIVLLYTLLFKVNPGSLILIDEPELSLHVVWQQQFLEDLKRITEIGEFDVLIATHSPEIIHDRWDLTVELKGPNGAETFNR